MRTAPEIVLTDKEQATLKALVRSKLTSVRLALRAHRAAAVQGQRNQDIAAQWGAGKCRAIGAPTA